MEVVVDTSGLMTLRQKIEGKSKQVAYATSRALNAAAYAAMKATSREMSRVFDKPTPWVSRSVRYTKSTKANLTATVDFEQWGNKQGVTASQVLRAEIHGGSRRLKRFEQALRRIHVLPDGMACVPGKRVKLDQFGNVPASLIVQVLSWFQAFSEQGYRANSTAKSRAARWKGRNGVGGFEFFALPQRKGKLPPGIYMRKNYGAEGKARTAHLANDGAFLIFAFVRMPVYRARFDFYGLAQREARKEFDAKFPGYLKEALATAR